jgi:PmbA protein
VVLEGASPLGDKLGKQVFDNKLSLVDDATLAYRPTSRPCDDEGVASRRIPLINEGRVSSFLYDLKTAAKVGTVSTGSGGRGGGLPSPSYSALIFNPGDTAFEDMVADIKEGLIVEYLMGAGQSNVLGGDFSGNVLLGYKIEDGKIVGRVKDTMVSGNIYKVLKEVVAIGSDNRWVGDTMNTPSIYCPVLAVASK